MTLHLTFDDGPDERWTPAILDLLAEYNVKATFFVVGSQIAGREGMVLRADYEGHTVANHSWSHMRLTGPKLTHNVIHRELKDTSAAIEAVTSSWPRVWRAPYYATDARSLAIARSLGLTDHIESDIIPDDWMLDSAEEIAGRVLNEHRPIPGSQIVTLHDGIPPDGGSEHCTQSRQPTVDAVRMILEAMA